MDYRDATGLTIGSVAAVGTLVPAVSGITSGNNNVALQTGGALTINNQINAGGGNVGLQSAGGVTQGVVGTLLANNLNVQGSGAFTLTNAGNDVNVMGANVIGPLQYTDANGLTIGSVPAVGIIPAIAGITSDNNNVTLTANTGNLTLNEVVNAGTSSVSLTALTGSILDGNSGANNLTASTANLSAANSIGTTGDPLDTTVNVLNASTTAGGIFVSEADAVTLGTVSATGGNIAISNSTGDMTITSVSAPAGTVDLSALGGSILSGGGAGPHLTAGGNSTLQAFNGVVGTQAAPINVAVNPGTLSIRATTAVAGISAFLTGTVLPGNMLTLLNVPPGLVCFNGCPVLPSNNPFGGFFGLIPSFNRDSVVPWYLHEPSDPPLVSVVSTYLPETVLAEAETDVKSDGRSVAREIPPCFPKSACRPGASILTAPADGQDPELTTAR